jgi:hypothetical protein
MRYTASLAAFMVLCAGAVLADESPFTITISDKEPPAELDAATREKIAPKSYAISDADGLFYEFWLVPEVPIKALKSDNEEALEAIEEITLLGAMVVHQEERYDFRDDPIDPGTYVMRLALQPQDGNHMGTSPWDFFALLMPYEKDHELEKWRDHETMVELSLEDTASAHPPIFALQPMESADGEFPRMGYDEEDEWDYICLNLPVVTESGEKGSIQVRMVIEGIGDV